MEHKPDLIIMGQKIKDLRIKKNLTQEELAKKLGYTSRSTVNKIEKGIVNIPQSKIIEIAKLFDTTPIYLLGWVDNNKENKNEIIIISEEYGTIKYCFNKKETKELINYIASYFNKDK